MATTQRARAAPESPISEMRSGRSARIRLLTRRFFEPAAALCGLAVVVTCTKMNALTTDSSPTAPRSLSTQGPSSEPSKNASAAMGNSSEASVSNAKAVPTGDVAPTEMRFEELPQFHRALKELAQGTRKEPLRILWFGDSHTAADYLPNAVRKQLSKVVPSGGPGYVGLGIPNYRHGLARAWSEGNLELAPHPPARRVPEDDGVFGLGGTRTSLREATAFITTRAVLNGPVVSMHYDLIYRLTGASDVLRVTAGEQRAELSASSGDLDASGLRKHRLTAPSSTTIEVRATRGRPQLFGIIMETELPGLVVDTLGINGARFGTFLAWQEESFVSQVEQRHPVMFVVAYGTNEIFDSEPVERHAQKLEQVVMRLRRAAPDADCIVVGPTDAGRGGESTRERAVALDVAERSAAERLSCAYFSPCETMMADGGFDAWARREPPLALSDGVHLSVRGYTRLADTMHARLLRSR